MAGHTFIAKVKAFFQRLFRKPVKETPVKEEPVKGQKVPLHILDGVCCGLSPTEVEVQDHLDHLVWKGEYERPTSLEGYRLLEEERARFDADMKEARAKWEQGKEAERKVYATIGYNPPSLYNDDDDEFRHSQERVEVLKKHHAGIMQADDEQDSPPMQIPRGWGYTPDGLTFNVKHQEVIEMLEGKEL